ncbi:heme ABC transporter ATP-binding protein [Sphingobacterium bambusae]|uniref:Heme ABC transporter ATP-binding protein n=1 Tax=Sphingobacterium bambusae TaxID=662858 RepID=A0ABW6BFX8_9SPHI|nr:heme ABC transporter ATP-binding protein [Sphingobacterium bambusae]WPL47535.1 heme ABC transporter ATP-binding protein [Sphingobacterium bambusae]
MIRVESISFEINKRHLLKDITFSIRKGEMLAILGANGAGKSTLMKILCREKNPSEGRIIYNGRDMNSYSIKELANMRATLYQQNAISLAFTVQEVVLMGRYGKSGKAPELSDEVVLEETMSVCGIAHLAERSMLTLSGGEQQRVHFARVLAQIWDCKEALLLLDEPIANMDMLYQHQTLAIANALTKKGFMVICVLHEINLAAQYADRVIMLKGGRKWWDGTPEEVFTAKNIFSAFGVDAQVRIDPQTLTTQIAPVAVRLEATHFNSSMAASYHQLSLKERMLTYIEQNPEKALWQVADALGTREADLLLIDLGKDVFLLGNDMEKILQRIESLGWVKAMTYNPHCENQREGVYRNFSKEEHVTLFLGEDIDLRIFASRWSLALAVCKPGKESLQFFDKMGKAVHKIMLTEGSYREAFMELVADFKDIQQSLPAFERATRKGMPERRDAEIDVVEFRRSWDSMQDTHEFFGLLRRYGMTRMQALRLAAGRRAVQVTLESFRRTIMQCSLEKIPLMVFTANEGCVQINTGELKRIDQQGKWLTLQSNSTGQIRLNEDAVNSVWHVVKPTADGDVNSLELYDTEGEMIVQFFGERKPGIAELESWREALGHGVV